MAQIIFYGQVLGFEPARNPGETKGYVKLFDRDTKRNFELGCKFELVEDSIPVTPERFLIDGVTISNGKNGVYMTCTNLQVLRDEPRRQRQSENSG